MAFEQNEIKKVINIDTGNSTKTLQDLVNQVEALKKSLNGMDTSTAEYKTKNDQYIKALVQLYTALGVTKKTADSTSTSFKRLATEGSTSSKILGEVGKVGTDVFQKGMDDALNKVITSTVGLNSNFGVVIKTMIQTGKTAMTAGKQMSTATTLASGGLTLIIDAIILLIAYWDDVSKACSKAVDWVKSLIGIQPEYTEAVYDSETAWNNLTDSIDAANSKLNYHLELMRLEGKTAYEIAQYNTKALEAQLAAARQEQKRAGQSGDLSADELAKYNQRVNELTDRVNAARAQESIAYLRQKKQADEAVESETKRHHSAIHTSTREHIDREQQQREQQVEQILERLHQANTDELVLLQEKYEEEKKLLEDAGKDTTQLTEEYEQKRRDIIIKQRQELQTELDALNKQQIEEANRERTIAQDNLQIQRSTQDNEGRDPFEVKQEELDANFAIEQEYYNKRIALGQEYLDNFLGSEEQKKQAEIELDDLRRELAKREAKYNEETTKNTKAQATQQKKDKEVALKASLQTAGQVFGSLSDLMEEGSESQKLFSIMETTMATLTGAIEAYKSMATIPIVGPALGVAAAAAVTAAGIANINKIRETTKDNAGTQLSSSSMSQLSMTQVNPLLDENTDLNRLTSLNEQGDSTQNQQNVRVYVVDQDIRDANNRAEVVDQNTTF